MMPNVEWQHGFAWRFAVVLLTVGIAAYVGSQVLTRDQAVEETPSTTTEIAGPDIAGPDVEIDNPLLVGIPISANEAMNMLTGCGCPTLPSTGALSPTHVTGAWKDDEPQVAFEFDNGVLLIYSPETRTPSQFVAEIQNFLQSGEADWSLVSVRNTSGLGSDIDILGPAGISWVEGNKLIHIGGDGGQTLAQLQSLAAQLGPLV